MGASCCSAKQSAKARKEIRENQYITKEEKPT